MSQHMLRELLAYGVEAQSHVACLMSKPKLGQKQNESKY